jgi:xylulokinase
LPEHYVEKFAGRKLSPLRLLGGGAQSALWCQIYANTLDRDVEQVTQPLLAQLRGTALLASMALGQRTLGDASQLPHGTMFSPEATARHVYGEKVNELSRLYARDKKWSKRR